MLHLLLYPTDKFRELYAEPHEERKQGNAREEEHRP